METPVLSDNEGGVWLKFLGHACNQQNKSDGVSYEANNHSAHTRLVAGDESILGSMPKLEEFSTVCCKLCRMPVKLQSIKEHMSSKHPSCNADRLREESENVQFRITIASIPDSLRSSLPIASRNSSSPINTRSPSDYTSVGMSPKMSSTRRQRQRTDHGRTRVKPSSLDDSSCRLSQESRAKTAKSAVGAPAVCRKLESHDPPATCNASAAGAQTDASNSSAVVISASLSSEESVGALVNLNNKVPMELYDILAMFESDTAAEVSQDKCPSSTASGVSSRQTDEDSVSLMTGVSASKNATHYNHVNTKTATAMPGSVKRRQSALENMADGAVVVNHTPVKPERSTSIMSDSSADDDSSRLCVPASAVSSIADSHSSTSLSYSRVTSSACSSVINSSARLVSSSSPLGSSGKSSSSVISMVMGEWRASLPESPALPTASARRSRGGQANRQYDPRVNCGVWVSDRSRHCMRALDCRQHNLEQKSRVVRPQPFRELLKRFKADKHSKTSQLRNDSQSVSTDGHPVPASSCSEAVSRLSGADSVSLNRAGTAVVEGVGSGTAGMVTYHDITNSPIFRRDRQLSMRPLIKTALSPAASSALPSQYAASRVSYCPPAGGDAFQVQSLQPPHLPHVRCHPQPLAVCGHSPWYKSQRSSLDMDCRLRMLRRAVGSILHSSTSAISTSIATATTSSHTAVPSAGQSLLKRSQSTVFGCSGGLMKCNSVLAGAVQRRVVASPSAAVCTSSLTCSSWSAAATITPSVGWINSAGALQLPERTAAGTSVTSSGSYQSSRLFNVHHRGRSQSQTMLHSAAVTVEAGTAAAPTASTLLSSNMCQ